MQHIAVYKYSVKNYENVGPTTTIQMFMLYWLTVSGIITVLSMAERQYSGELGRIEYPPPPKGWLCLPENFSKVRFLQSKHFWTL